MQGHKDRIVINVRSLLIILILQYQPVVVLVPHLFMDLVGRDVMMGAPTIGRMCLMNTGPIAILVIRNVWSVARHGVTRTFFLIFESHSIYTLSVID